MPEKSFPTLTAEDEPYCSSSDLYKAFNLSISSDVYSPFSEYNWTHFCRPIKYLLTVSNSMNTATKPKNENTSLNNKAKYKGQEV